MKVVLTFVNASDEEVDVYWLDYEGTPVQYRTLEPGESARQETFASHPWELISERGARLLFVATEVDATVTFDG